MLKISSGRRTDFLCFIEYGISKVQAREPNPKRETEDRAQPGLQCQVGSADRARRPEQLLLVLPAVAAFLSSSHFTRDGRHPISFLSHRFNDR